MLCKICGWKDYSRSLVCPMDGVTYGENYPVEYAHQEKHRLHRAYSRPVEVGVNRAQDALYTPEPGSYDDKLCRLVLDVLERHPNNNASDAANVQAVRRLYNARFVPKSKDYGCGTCGAAFSTNRPVACCPICRGTEKVTTNGT